MKEINETEVTAPVKVGDVAKENIAGTGIDLIVTADRLDCNLSQKESAYKVWPLYFCLFKKRLERSKMGNIRKDVTRLKYKKELKWLKNYTIFFQNRKHRKNSKINRRKYRRRPL